MAEQKESIFRKSGLARINSPEQLNDYIKVTKPSVWIILVVVLLVLAGLFSWAMIGDLPTYTSAEAYSENGTLVCYLDPEIADDIRAGMEVTSEKAQGKVLSVGRIPMSSQEVSDKIRSDYVLSELEIGQWNTEVTMEADGLEDGLHTVRILTDTIKPYEFIFN